MELMRDAGLTPMQIIQAFSKNNSEMLGIDKDFGTLAKGKAADLLVLDEEPARRHHQHAQHRGRLSRRQEIRIGKRPDEIDR